MTRISRRVFNRNVVAGIGGALASAVVAPDVEAKKRSSAIGGKKAKIVIIGGGVGGISVANFIRQKTSRIKITLIEPRKTYTSCFFSNHYIAGFRSLDSLNHSYEAMKSLGIDFISDYAVQVDYQKKQVVLKGGNKVSFDRLIVSPGITVDYNQFDGYSQEAAHVMPHAWQFGQQSKVLRKKLLDMEDGGVVSLVIGAGADQGRSPYAAYERASLIAHYLKSYKPASKLMIFDSKPKFAMQPLYEESWKKYYPGLLEWVGSQTTNGGIRRIDHNSGVLVDGNGEEIKTDVATIIPKQKAGLVADTFGLTQGDWCPVEAQSYRSSVNKDVYVLGDAAQNGIMPRTASAAHSQATVVGNALLAELANKKRFPARFTNTCWAVLSTNDAIKFGNSFKAGKEEVKQTGAFVSSVGEGEKVRAKTYKEAQDWYKAISSEIFSKGNT